MKNTYAHRAKKIMKRYPYADRVPSDREARDGELKVLFQEQEVAKKSRQNSNEFADGGKTMGNNFRSRSLKSFAEVMYDPQKEFYKPEFSLSTVEKGFTPRFGGDYFSKEYELPMGNEYLNKDFDPTEFDYNPEDAPRDSHLSSYLNVGSGLVAAGANLANMLTMKDVNRIRPTMVNPTFKFRGLDLTPYQTALNNQLQTTNYNLLQSGADFDTVSGGMIKANNSIASAMGQVTVEEQKLNNAEGARGDEIMNKGIFYNAEKINQSKVDMAVRNDEREQKRRNYLTALSENLKSILTDESDRAYANELEPTLSRIAAYQAILGDGNKQTG